jgi:molybdopterin-guanine dinucleotide biosynthesis protein A
MGGLCAALHHATAVGFDAVLSAPCDLLGIPPTLAVQLSPGPAVADEQWLLGLWPAALAPRLEALLRAEGNVSARRWMEVANVVRLPVSGMLNVNFPADLD